MMVLKARNTFAALPLFRYTEKSLLYRNLPFIRPLGITNHSNEVLPHILLYGCMGLPADCNREILQGIVSFIRETGHFNQHVYDAKKEFPKVFGPFSIMLALL